MNKRWYIQTMKFYSALKRNELWSHEKTWRNLKCILLSERSQSEKGTYLWFQLYDVLEKAKSWGLKAKYQWWDFPGSPVVKTSKAFQCRGAGSIPGQQAKIPHASQPKNQNGKQKQYYNKFNKDFKNGPHRASLVVQWLRICLPLQGTRVRTLVWEDSTCRRATGPVSHNYWACASGACAPQQERPR